MQQFLLRNAHGMEEAQIQKICISIPGKTNASDIMTDFGHL